MLRAVARVLFVAAVLGLFHLLASKTHWMYVVRGSLQTIKMPLALTGLIISLTLCRNMVRKLRERKWTRCVQVPAAIVVLLAGLPALSWTTTHVYEGTLDRIGFAYWKADPESVIQMVFIPNKWEKRWQEIDHNSYRVYGQGGMVAYDARDHYNQLWRILKPVSKVTGNPIVSLATLFGLCFISFVLLWSVSDVAGLLPATARHCLSPESDENARHRCSSPYPALLAGAKWTLWILILGLILLI